MSKKITYLDWFLFNEEEKELVSKKKKKKWSFEKRHEDAILLFNSGTLTNNDAERLWTSTIYPSLKTIVNGVLQMKKFHFLPRTIDRELLIDDTILRLIEKLDKFQAGMIGKTGEPVKAFSYFSTIAKNYILGTILKANKVIENKADVETNIDLHILSEETLEKLTGSTAITYEIESNFELIRKDLIRSIEKIVYSQKNLESDFVKLGLVLIYLFKNWSKIDFDKKNNFTRLLILYSNLKQPNVSIIFKKYKTLLEKEKNLPYLFDKLGVGKTYSKEIEVEEDFEFEEEIKEDGLTKKEREKELYSFKSFEEFEMEQDLLKYKREILEENESDYEVDEEDI